MSGKKDDPNSPLGFWEFVGVARVFLEQYPPDVFAGGKAGTEIGVEFVCDIRRAVDNLDRARQAKTKRESIG